MGRAVEVSEAVPAEPISERAIAAALLGHALLAGVELEPSALTPETRASLRSQALAYFTYCRDRFGEGPSAAPWRGYCADRAQALSDP